jgi:hypothetical protein
VLTSPLHPTGDQTAYGQRQRVADSCEMVRVGLQRRPLTATAVVAWNADLPRDLQQVLFDTADAGIPLADLSAMEAVAPRFRDGGRRVSEFAGIRAAIGDELIVARSC